MRGLRIYRTVWLVLLGCLLMFGMASQAHAQSGATASTAESANDVDIEFQLHLLVASKDAVEGAKLPASLEAVTRDLRPLLPFTNYRLGATFLSRVKNGKQLNVKGVGRTLLVTPMLEASVNPTFYEIYAGVSVKPDESGRNVVQLSSFRFGLRIPLQGTTPRSGNSSDETASTVLYEPIGLTTDVTMREGEPAVIGTLDAGRPNETLVLVVVAKRVGMR